MTEPIVNKKNSASMTWAIAATGARVRSLPFVRHGFTA
jgi:hypothetical protein